VLIGIRGENASKLVNYLDLLECDEIYNSWTIFRTNQATDAHIQYVNENIAQYSVISSIVTISSYSKDIEGGHVKIQAYINLQSVTLIAFEPTKIIPKKLRLLVPGDKIYIHGSVGSFQESLQINLEFFEIIHLMDHYRIKTPECACGNIMKKLGTFKGYKCSLCKNISFMPIKIQNERSLFLGEKIYASLSSQRHLTRPRKRLHRRNRDVPIKVTYDMIRRLFK
ncbi:MAG: DUF1743 domain-containing protein, partial [Candidatus Heimdallarchaeota archaeon]|nr:DUF1743 domain-containing protein [Candidatus Heimdallarchaeota archaeon]